MKLFSGKSLRQSSITESLNSNKISVPEGAARTGHSTGTCMDSYRDKSNPTNGLRAAKQLAKFPDLDSAVIVPRLTALGSANLEMAKRFMDTLFPTDVKLFKSGMKLRPILEICCASMIQYHRDVSKDSGVSNIISSRMRQVADEISLVDPLHPHLSPALVLKEWSIIIEKDVLDRRLGASRADPNLVSITATLNQLVTMVASLQTDLRDVKEHSTDLAATVACQESEICQLRQKESSYHAENSKLVTLLTTAKAQLKAMQLYVSTSFASPAAATYSPQAQTTLKRRRLELEDVDEEFAIQEDDNVNADVNEDGNVNINGDLIGASSATTTPADTPVHGGSNDRGGSSTSLSSLFFSQSISSSARREGVRHLDQWNTRAESISKKKAAEGMEFAKRLQVFADERKLSLDKKLKPTNLGIGYPNKALMVYCLELADVAATKEQKDELHSGDRLKVITASQQIQESMMSKLLHYEGSTDAIEAASVKSGKSRKSTGYTGIGTRVKKYKIELLVMKGMTQQQCQLKDVTLVDKSVVVDVRRTGTPDGNHSIRSLMPPNNGTRMD